VRQQARGTRRLMIPCKEQRCQACQYGCVN
jgi:hypothetical protein